MKIAVDFPSVAYREGPQQVLALASAIEQIGYDEIAAFDHVVMGYPSQDRRTIYSAEMPILEALMLLANGAGGGGVSVAQDACLVAEGGKETPFWGTYLACAHRRACLTRCCVSQRVAPSAHHQWR